MWLVKTFGQRHREVRKQAGLTQEEIAAVCKNRDGTPLSGSAISGWENDKDRPSFDNLYATASKMGASVDYLMGLSDKRSAPIGRVDTGRLADVIEILEETLPHNRYPIPAQKRAEIIEKLYLLVSPDGQLPTAEVVKLIRPVKAKFTEGADSHGNKVVKRRS
jgi:transcriptional regulator with XRE-family HTH domain